MTYEPSGTVTKRTANRFSLAHSLGYRIHQSGSLLFMHRLTPGGRSVQPVLKLRGCCKPENLYAWLEARHDIKKVDSVSELKEPFI